LDPVTLGPLIRLAGLAQSPLGVIIVDAGLRIDWANQAAERLGGGQQATAWPRRRLGEVLPQLDTDTIERSLRQVVATGKPAIDLQVSSHVGDPSGERFWSCTQFQVTGAHGQAAGATCVIREVTEQARNQRRLALADEASARIGTTLDITRTAEELLDVAVPRIADMGTVDLLGTVIEGDRPAPQTHDQTMHLQRVAVRWPAHVPLPAEYHRQAWYEAGTAKLHHQRLVAGLPVYLPTFGAMTPEQIREVSSGAGFDRMMTARQAGAHSLIIVPLLARRVIMGHVILYRLAGSKPFTAADLALARDFVSHAAVSIDNARLYTPAAPWSCTPTGSSRSPAPTSAPGWRAWPPLWPPSPRCLSPRPATPCWPPWPPARPTTSPSSWPEPDTGCDPPWPVRRLWSAARTQVDGRLGRCPPGWRSGPVLRGGGRRSCPGSAPGAT
jgi:hypothetical protein